MRRIITILAILLILVMLNSGSGVAPTRYYAVDVADFDECINPFYAIGPPNGSKASLKDSTNGWIILDFGEGNEMGANEDFTIHSNSANAEYYKVYIYTGNWDYYEIPFSPWDDTTARTFSTPGYGTWRYVEIICTYSTGDDDPLPGAEVDAVSYDA